MPLNNSPIDSIAEFQNAAHGALSAVISGGVLRPITSMAGIPHARCHPLWTDRLKRLHADARQYGTGTDEPVQSVKTLRDAARITAIACHALRHSVDGLELSTGAESIDVGADCNGTSWAPDEGTPLAALQRTFSTEFGEYLAGSFVHGSHGTGDHNAYSDLDTLVILRQSVVEDPERLYHCAIQLIDSRQHLFACDLLQHHGHFVLTEADFQWYCDSYFPRTLFRFARRLTGKGPVVINATRDSSKEARRHLEDMCGRFINPKSDVHLRRGYYLKLFLSCFMILPALVVQARGPACYKRHSFSLARPFFSADTWEIMDEVSALRERWRQTSPDCGWHTMARANPLVFQALVAMTGQWGVPDEIWLSVRKDSFRARMRQFAQEALTAGLGDEQHEKMHRQQDIGSRNSRLEVKP